MTVGAYPAHPAAPAPRRVAGDRVLAPIYARGDRYMGVLVALHVAVAAALAPVYATWAVSTAVALAAAGAFYLARRLGPGMLATRCIAGLVLQTFCALHIYQMNGMAEMHFFYFTSVTAMILYQDWRALWPGVVAIIAQHTLFAAGHNGGWHPGGQTFFEVGYVEPLKLTAHFGIALAQTAIASVASRALRARTLADAAQQRRLREANGVLEVQGAELEAANLQLQEQAAELEQQAAALEERAIERARLFAAEAEARARAEAARTEAEAANRAKSDFLATMSHELRTPLNAIAGYVQLLTMEIYGPTTGPQRQALERVERSQRHLLGLINDVLNHAKLEAGRVEYHMHAVPVDTVVRDLAAMLEAQLVGKALTLSVALEPGLMAWADRAKLTQVLINLLGNAVKFTPPQGHITVRAAFAAEAPDRVRLDVADTGIGIPADRLASVFDPFVQAENGLNRPHEGTGLGLAIGRDLARGMGGDLTVTSERGAGSTFTLTLAAAPPASVGSVAHATDDGHAAPSHALGAPGDGAAMRREAAGGQRT